MTKKPQYNIRNHKSLGFTLIELMVVLVIAAVLIGLALPAYQQYVYKSRRADATVAIRNIQLTEEKYRANNTTYGTVTDLGISSATTAGYYTLAVTSNTGTGY